MSQCTMPVLQPAEAITCAVRVKSKKVEKPNTVFVSELVPPHRMSVIQNYTQGVGIEIIKLPHGEDGLLDLEKASLASGSCAVYVERPNSFGILDEGLMRLREIVGEKTAIIVGVDVTTLGLVEPPGNWGADIVVGEGTFRNRAYCWRAHLWHICMYEGLPPPNAR